jgi:hypothetical protein
MDERTLYGLIGIALFVVGGMMLENAMAATSSPSQAF